MLKKILVPVIISLLIIIAVVTAGNSYLGKKQSEEESKERLMIASNIVKNYYESKMNEALIISETMANDSNLVKLLIDENREEIEKQYVPLFNYYKDKFNLTVAHIRSPYNVSYIRLQDPSNYGQKTNEGIFQLVYDTQVAYKGFRAASHGIGVRGWSPIIYNDQVIATVEANVAINAAELFERLKVDYTDAVVYGEYHDKDKDEKGIYILAATNPKFGYSDKERNRELFFFTPDDLEKEGIFKKENYAYKVEHLKDPDNKVVAWSVITVDEFQIYKDMVAPQLYISFIIALITIILMILLITVVKHVVGPVKNIKEVAEKISEGDLSVVIQRMNTKDEIESLVDSFNAIKDSVRKPMEAINLVAASLVDSSNILEDLLAENKETFLLSDTRVNDIMQAIKEQTSTLSEASNAMEEIATGVTNMAENISYIQTMTSEANNNVYEGGKVVDLSVTQMNRIQTVQETVLKELSGLNENINHINKFNSIISGVASQTNLLALNASIEAARAGEHGRGFAIVADEVRKLAEQSAKITEEVGGIVGTITTSIDSTITKYKDISAEIERGITSVGSITSVFSNIQKAMTKVDSAVSELSTLSVQMSAASQEVSASVIDIEEQSKNSNGKASEIAESMGEQLKKIDEIYNVSIELKEQAEELKKSVCRFSF